MGDTGGVPEEAARTQRVLALAKLTLSLRVAGVRSDGYHVIDAEMVTVDLADALVLSPGDALEVVGVSARAGAGVPADDGNLVHRALRAVGRRAHVRLEKRIPAGAGLGGGSADAAAVLRWAGLTGTSRDELTLAAGLGGDVPFCLVGGRARVRGMGEDVEALPFEARTFTLLIPPFGVSTAAAYRARDRLARRSRHVGAGGDTGAGAGTNDLEAAALSVEPRLAAWRDRLGDATGEEPMLAGSGSTWFVEGAFPGGDRVVVHTEEP
jgi:4-diphosphocytidyl-2-C-methyl-D-erythritol kinase